MGGANFFKHAQLSKNFCFKKYFMSTLFLEYNYILIYFNSSLQPLKITQVQHHGREETL